MTYRDVDRAVVDWLVGQESRAGYLDAVLAETSRTRQRPAWSFPGRWLPVQLTLERVAVPRWVPYAALLALLALALAIALALVGSARPLPPPFGLAANGLLAYTSVDGDIVLADPVTGQVRPLVSGVEGDTSPVFSRDGTKVAFSRIVPGGRALFVVSDTGGTPLRLGAQAVDEIDEISWSPDGSRIAFVGGGRLLVIPTDGSGSATALALGDTGAVDSIAWRPNGDQILFRGTSSAGVRLYLTNAMGSTPVAVTDFSTSDDEFAYIFPAFDPSGTRLVAQNVYPGGLVVLDLLPGSTNVTAQHELAVPAGWETAFAPQISPDGSRVAMAVSGNAGARIAIVPIADPAAAAVTGPLISNLDFGHVWSPDATTVLLSKAALGGTWEAWLLDPGGGQARSLGFENARDLNWQRVAVDADGAD